MLSAHAIFSRIQYLQDENQGSIVQIAVVHSLRRIFVHLLEDGQLTDVKKVDSSKVREFRLWLREQFSCYKEHLLQWINSSTDVDKIAVSIRTLVEVG